jgi:hypothetical protein
MDERIQNLATSPPTLPRSPLLNAARKIGTASQKGFEFVGGTFFVLLSFQMQVSDNAMVCYDPVPLSPAPFIFFPTG